MTRYTNSSRPRPLWAPLCIVLAPAVAAAALEDNAADVETPPDIAAYERRIDDIDMREGAYGANLSEPLLELGLALQSQGRHEEAVDLFRRGVHLTRINDGLYSARQIPLLQGEIASYIARGDYLAADERQRYLYRVQLRRGDAGVPLTGAYMQQANWQFEAYRLGLDPRDYTRLMNMWEFYRLALNEVIDEEGETSPRLVAPLYGMLQAQYLISGYDWEDDARGTGDDIRARQDLYRFTAYQAQSYEKGSVVIRAIRSVEQEQADDPGRQLEAARALVMLGDWHLYHDETEEAWAAYARATAELAARGDAETRVTELFGAPVALPDLDGLRELPPAVEADAGDVLIQFTVTDTGRAHDIERLDDNEEMDGKAYRLMRKLRDTRFRPRLVAGKPVETEHVVRAYSLQ